MPRNCLALFSTCFIALSLITSRAYPQEALQPIARFGMPASVQGPFDHLGIDSGSTPGAIYTYLLR